MVGVGVGFAFVLLHVFVFVVVAVQRFQEKDVVIVVLLSCLSRRFTGSCVFLSVQ